MQSNSSTGIQRKLTGYSESTGIPILHNTSWGKCENVPKNSLKSPKFCRTCKTTFGHYASIYSQFKYELEPIPDNWSKDNKLVEDFETANEFSTGRLVNLFNTEYCSRNVAGNTNGKQVNFLVPPKSTEEKKMEVSNNYCNSSGLEGARRLLGLKTKGESVKRVLSWTNSFNRANKSNESNNVAVAVETAATNNEYIMKQDCSTNLTIGRSFNYKLGGEKVCEGFVAGDYCGNSTISLIELRESGGVTPQMALPTIQKDLKLCGILRKLVRI